LKGEESSDNAKLKKESKIVDTYKTFPLDELTPGMNPAS
jgi:hypothetical protein